MNHTKVIGLELSLHEHNCLQVAIDTSIEETIELINELMSTEDLKQTDTQIELEDFTKRLRAYTKMKEVIG